MISPACRWRRAYGWPSRSPCCVTARRGRHRAAVARSNALRSCWHSRVCVPVAVWLALRATKPWTDTLTALKDGVASLRDHDFSLSIARGTNDELGDLVDAYNSLGSVLRRERLDLHQRELMLDTVIQTSPLALVLTNANARIVFSNIAARQLLNSGRKLEGLDFTEVLKQARRSRCATRSPAARIRCSPCRKARRRTCSTSPSGTSC